jgi:hypothetical protein
MLIVRTMVTLASGAATPEAVSSKEISRPDCCSGQTCEKASHAIALVCAAEAI